LRDWRLEDGAAQGRSIRNEQLEPFINQQLAVAVVSVAPTAVFGPLRDARSMHVEQV
jgi:hypothetical protein